MPKLSDLFKGHAGAPADNTRYVYEPKQLENPKRYSIGAPEETSSLSRLASLRKQDLKDSTNYARQQENKASNQGVKNVAENVAAALSLSYYAKLLGVPDGPAAAFDFLPVGAGEGKMLAMGMFGWGKKARAEAKRLADEARYAALDEMPGSRHSEDFELRPFDAEAAAANRALREEEAIKRGRFSADSLANLAREPSNYGPWLASKHEPFELRPYHGPKTRQGGDRKWQLDSLWAEMAANPNSTPPGLWGSKEFKAKEEAAHKYRNNPGFKAAYLRDWEIQEELKRIQGGYGHD